MEAANNHSYDESDEHSHDGSSDDDPSDHPTIPVSTILRAAATLRKYGPVLTLKEMQAWAHTDPHRHVKIASDLLAVQLYDSAMGCRVMTALLQFATGDIIASANTGPRQACVMFAIVDSASSDANDATAEIISRWQAFVGGPCDLKYTSMYAIAAFHADNASIKILLRRQRITRERAIRTWPSVETTTTFHVSLGALLEYSLDVWGLGPDTETRSVVSGHKYAWGCTVDDVDEQARACAEELRKCAQANKFHVQLKQHDRRMIFTPQPVDPIKIREAIIACAGGELQDLQVSYHWTPPIEISREIHAIMTKYQMRMVAPSHYICLPRYKEPKSDTPACAPWQGLHKNATWSPRWCGFADVEHAARLLRLRLQPVIPKVVWNGIVRLVLYYHAIWAVSPAVMLPQETTFQDIIGRV
jgi:hypothetical protein